MDYLLEEVLKRQPELMRTFLLKTSILERLCGPLCEAIVGETRERIDGQAILQELERRNLFLVPLDDNRTGTATITFSRTCSTSISSA